jgi:predicted HicB family RNase H-like nuclease
MSSADAVAELQAVYGMSRRQAYRYVETAQSLKHPIPTPQNKTAFTVKVPVELVDAIREKARSTGRSISEIVTEALERLLNRGRGRG